MRSQQNGHFGFEDARFFACDFGERVAEDAGVFQADAGDDREVRVLNHVGRIKASAETDFDHGDIDVFVGEVLIGQRREELKVGRLLILRELFKHGAECGDLVVEVVL